MPQVSLYIEQDIIDAARQSARIEQISLSRYVADALRHKNASGWPQGYWELFGCLKDDSFVLPSEMPFDEVRDKASFS